MAGIITRLGTPTAAALGLGLTASGYFTFGNYGAACFGIMPAIVPGRDSVRLEAGKAVELWAFFYEKAAVHFSTASLTAATSYFAAGYLYAGPARHVKGMLFGAGAVILSILPWTVILMLPINKELLATRDSVRSGSGRELTIDEAEASWGRLGAWNRLHIYRMLCGAASYAVGLAALLQV
ncbi:hypothetical protein HDZ31DRAFT_36976 [Schizophyllum fasciatum]